MAGCNDWGTSADLTYAGRPRLEPLPVGGQGWSRGAVGSEPPVTAPSARSFSNAVEHGLLALRVTGSCALSRNGVAEGKMATSQVDAWTYPDGVGHRFASRLVSDGDAWVRSA